MFRGSGGEDSRDPTIFTIKWDLAKFINDANQNHKSCEMIARDILTLHLIPKYGADRYYEVVVSEDGESDGIIEYIPIDEF